MHVVGLVGGVRHERVEGAVGVVLGEVSLDVVRRDLIEVVAREEAEERLDEVHRLALVGGHRVGHTALAVVRARAAELVEADVLAGDGLDDVGPGDEHVRGLVDHDREVGDRGGVDGAAGARPHDQRDLRDHAGGEHVASEDLAVEAE